MNAGAWGQNIGDLVENVLVMDYNSNIKLLKRKELRFAYRSSSLAKLIILGASLRLKSSHRSKINIKIRDYLTARRQSQDLHLPNAGCVFKNPRGRSAGKLIDLCGLKGRVIGKARISDKHANFILNKGGAKAKDVLGLMKLIKGKVKNKFNIALEPEIRIWE